MKKIFVLFLSAGLFMTSCVSNPEGKKAETTDSVDAAGEVIGENYTIDNENSTLLWTGSKVTGQHFGNVTFKSGTIHVDNGSITGGDFILDMNTIVSNDLEGEYKDQLEGHLKSEDFFAVEEYPEAQFAITEVKTGANEGEIVISGNLTIKGVSKNITFDANVEELTETLVNAKADFNIAREDWGVNYAGKADDLISKEINFKLDITATK